jgi:hypothetical protein
MGRRLLAASAAAILGVTINIATDNADNALAWALVVGAVILVAVVAGHTDGDAAQRLRIRGARNKVHQRGKEATKDTSIRGDANDVQQTDR